MSDEMLDRQRAARRSIVETIVADIALRRAVPDVFLLDDAGKPVAWSAHTGSKLPPSLEALVDMYFAQDAAHRAALVELVDIDGTPTSVRIVPHHGEDATRYAVIVEPFVVRTRNVHGSGELTVPT